MLITILVGLIALVVVISMIADAWDWTEGLMYGFLGVILSLVIGMPALFGLNFVVSRPMDRHYITEHRELVALQDGSQTTGSFFLGSGYIDGKQVYSYYLKEGDGFKLSNSDAATVTVYQDTDKPYLIQQTDCKTSMEWLAFCVSDERVTEIHVPKGTIKENFILDAQ